jgi:hypothetical protein
VSGPSVDETPVRPTDQLAHRRTFYVGIGFCSHYPVTVDTGVVSNLVLENSAGKMQ